MKAQDLMIGDWVVFPEGIGRVIHFGIEFIIARVDEHERMRQVSKIKPIPITPEILEKNGFEKTSDGWECYESDVLTIAIHDGDSCDIWLAEAPFEHKHLMYTLPFPRFVHELQHALRLCEIDKTIEL